MEYHGTRGHPPFYSPYRVERPPARAAFLLSFKNGHICRTTSLAPRTTHFHVWYLVPRYKVKTIKVHIASSCWRERLAYKLPCFSRGRLDWSRLGFRMYVITREVLPHMWYFWLGGRYIRQRWLSMNEGTASCTLRVTAWSITGDRSISERDR